MRLHKRLSGDLPGSEIGNRVRLVAIEPVIRVPLNTAKSVL
jgi:hypothetical protein